MGTNSYYLHLLFLLLIPNACSSKSKVYESNDAEDNFEERAGIPLHIEAHLEFAKTYLWINGTKVYSHEGNASLRGSILFQRHTGVHYIVLHQTTFEVLSKKIFYTSQASADKHLLRTLCNAHEGRILILLGSTNFTFWVRDELQEFLYDSGTLLGPEVALGEYWALIFRKGVSDWPEFELDAQYWEDNRTSEYLAKMKQKKERRQEESLVESVNLELSESRIRDLRNRSQDRYNRNIRKFSEIIKLRVKKKFKIIYEGLSIVRNYGEKQAAPLKFATSIYPIPEKKCSWHYSYGLRDLANFCTSYDGYGPYCRCNYRTKYLEKMPVRNFKGPKGKSPVSQENSIAVAIVTSSRLPQVMRQIQQLRAAEGGNDLNILLCVDSNVTEAADLAKLLGVDAMFHDSEAAKNTLHRVNLHIRWSLEQVFEFYPNATYAIILEDDLDLSPDFMRYFQQLSWLMDIDKTIMIANAYNYNAFSHSALNSSIIKLVQSYPYYGWMVRRRDAKKMVDYWANATAIVDWDLYIHYYHLNGSFVAIPEVPRTKHISGGGVHVSGFVQESQYSVRPMNKHAKVDLFLQRLWSKAYLIDIMKFIGEATVLNITQDICKHPPISADEVGGKYVLYVDVWGDQDNSSAYYVVMRCLGFYEENMFEQIEGTFQRKFYNNDLLVVACPVSPYCSIQDKSVVYKPTEEEIKSASLDPFRKMNTTNDVHLRTSPEDDMDEILLENTVSVSFNIKE